MPNYISRPIRKATAVGSARKTASASDAWCCSCCGKLLGIHRDGLMHVSFARGHEYLFSYPATATCRRCGTMSQTKGPAR
ncbi:hypothetical protein [Paracoccus sp. (in: a-proteobacteria)]|uniref:hypothetical protein n=1 Tax=Paracoccus sp. TaxID=267 RepID=UPI0035B162E3